jgi:hypothetical protein
MRWALVTHPQHVIKGRLVIPPKAIPEDSVAIAKAQGWILLETDSGVLESFNAVEVERRSVDEDGA